MYNTECQLHEFEAVSKVMPQPFLARPVSNERVDNYDFMLKRRGMPPPSNNLRFSNLRLCKQRDLR
jgi:hypothetical protein